MTAATRSNPSPSLEHGYTPTETKTDIGRSLEGSASEPAPNDVGLQHVTPERTLSSLRWWLYNLIIPLSILGLGFAALSAFGTVAPESRPPDDQSYAGRLRRLPAAEVAPVVPLDAVDKPLELRVDGVVVPYREVQIAAEVAGRIVKKSPACEAGNVVKAGDLLVEIDATDYEQEVERLTRMREQDYQSLREVDQEIANSRRLLELAQQDVDLQEREVKRLESMPAGFASQAELDRAKKTLLVAVQSRLGFDNQLELLAAKRNRLEAAERMATTQLRSAEINLERTKVYSPVNGVVVTENAELNSFIQRGAAIVTLEDVSKAEVAVNLRMDQLQWVLDQRNSVNEASNAVNESSPPSEQVDVPNGNRNGYTLPPTPALIEYEVAGRADRKFSWQGTLLRYDGIGLDPRSRTVPVIVVVDNPRHFEGADHQERDSQAPSPLVRGMFVQVRLQVRPKTRLVAIPSEAIQPGNRIWQFIPDDSVVASPATRNGEEAVAAQSSTTSGESQASVQANASSSSVEDPASPELTESGFDPQNWQAGRVVIRRNVIPVDALWLASDTGSATRDSANKPNTDQRRFWVCEIPGEPMGAGNWVVRSPLSDFEQELSVRVARDGLTAN